MSSPDAKNLKLIVYILNSEPEEEQIPKLQDQEPKLL